MAKTRDQRQKFDPSQLIDATEVAALLELSHRNSVSVYRKRYPDFPSPIIEKGRCLLWVRAEVQQWATGRENR